MFSWKDDISKTLTEKFRGAANLNEIHEPIYHKGWLLEGSRLKTVHGEISQNGDIENSAIETVHGDIVVDSDRITGLGVETTSGHVVLRANHIDGLDVYSIHEPVIIDTRTAGFLKNIKISCVHGDLILIAHEGDKRKFEDEIKFTSVHGEFQRVAAPPALDQLENSRAAELYNVMRLKKFDEPPKPSLESVLSPWS